ncbi:MAG: DUF6178 family protein [Desulfobacterota bacterium]|nr:DUF6178 family protein [Thermodesulfobacteriota bacterium]
MSDRPIRTVSQDIGHTLGELLLHDEAAAEKLFNQLSLRQKVQQVLAMPWDRRIRLIMLAENTRQLVQALPPDELYWTVKHHGIDDALSVISLTSHEQFQYFIDLDCWQRDDLDAAAVARWYRLLSRCSEAKVIEWFARADEPLLVSMLKLLMHVEKIEEQSDISEEYARMPLDTLDGIYFFSFLHEEAQSYLLPIMRTLYAYNQHLFYSLMEGIINDSAVETTDEALHWRRSRIEEHGFSDFDEAVSIYQFVSDKEIELLRKGCGHHIATGRISPADAAPVLRHRIAASGMPQILADALCKLPSPEMCERVQRLLVHVANKVLCADGRSVNSYDDALQALKKALGLAAIGLDVLSGGNPEFAIGVLEQVHPEILFRIGSSAVLKLQRRLSTVRQTLWSGAPEYCIDFFDPPWSDALQGLQRKRPLLFEGLVQPGSLDYRDFMSRQDLAALEQVIDIVEAVSHLLFIVWGVDQRQLFSEHFIAQTTLPDCSDLKSSAVFLTAVANHVLTGTSQPRPLSHEELMRFLEVAFEYRDERQSALLRPEFAANLTDWVHAQVSDTDRLHGGLDAFMSVCLGMLEEEFSLLIGKKTIDTRYVSGVLLRCG